MQLAKLRAARDVVVYGFVEEGVLGQGHTPLGRENWLIVIKWPRENGSRAAALQMASGAGFRELVER